MAVPKKRTSKAVRNKRRFGQRKMILPSVRYQNGKPSLYHYIKSDQTYRGKQIIKE